MSPSETWLGLLLSGLVGSIVGGAATFLAVWIALRHDRVIRREDRAAEAVAAAYASANVFNMAMTAADGQDSAHATAEAFEAFLRDASSVIALCRTVAPGFTNFFQKALDGSIEDVPDAEAFVFTLSTLHHWLSDPGQFERPGFTYEAMRERMTS